jgi:uncharacterized membrane protein
MELVGALIAFALLAVAIATPCLSLAAFIGQRSLRRRLQALEGELAALRTGALPPEPGNAAEAAPAEAAPVAPTLETAPPRAGRTTGWPTPTGWTGPAAAQGSASPGAAAPKESFEQRLTLRWLVWLGAGTLALAGVFLVKLAVDAGLVGPGARIVLGLLLGGALVAAGEALRRRQPGAARTAVRADHVPSALAAAGVFTLFAATYAAYALYGFLPSAAAFVALGLVALAAVALALLHGPLVALVGLAGGYATPLMVARAAPEAWLVFAYLAVLTLALLAVNRRVGWWPIPWLALGPALAWPLFWLDVAFAPGDAAVIGPYLLAVAAAALLPPRHAPPAGTASWRDASALLALAGVSAVAATLLVLARVDGHGGAALLAIAGLVLGVVAAARLVPHGEALLLPASLLVLALLALWQLPAEPFAPPPTAFRAPLLPPGIDRFVFNALGYAGLFGVAGFLVLRRARLPLVWAALSAAMPVLILCVAYWRLGGLAVDLRWTPLALVLAALAVAAAASLRRNPPADRLDDLLAAYAAAAVAALALAATMALREAWLSVALAAMLPALGWVGLRLESRRLRQLAGIVALAVLARLALNPFVLDYELGAIPTLGWVAYGYGLPALAFWAASRLFRRRGADWLVALLEGGAIAFAVLLVTLQIQLAVSGTLKAWPDDLLALGLQSIAWLLVALALTGREPWFTGTVVRWARWLLAGLALTQSLLLQAGAFNPLWSGAPVGDLPVLNLLLPAYALPAILALWYGQRETAAPWLARAASLAGLVLAFVFVSLSVRHAFHGPVLAGGVISNAEGFSYSGAWLVLAAVLLGLGVRRGSSPLRWASLGILMATVAKVFLFDMGDLGGLWRVASFLGLGLSLVAIGFVYQRFVFPPASPAAATAPT